MVFKLIFALAFIAGSVSAGYAPVYHAAAPASVPVHAAHTADSYDSQPQYQFSYGVDDSITGDSHNQLEERNGDVVRGEYSLIDADGYRRTVHYTADAHNGFNAVVNRELLVKTVAAAPAVVHHAAPAPVVRHVAPAPVVHHAAPASVAQYALSAPVARYTAPAAIVQHASYAAPAVNHRH